MKSSTLVLKLPCLEINTLKESEWSCLCVDGGLTYGFFNLIFSICRNTGRETIWENYSIYLEFLEIWGSTMLKLHIGKGFLSFELNVWGIFFHFGNT